MTDIARAADAAFGQWHDMGLHQGHEDGSGCAAARMAFLCAFERALNPEPRMEAVPAPRDLTPEETVARLEGRLLQAEFERSRLAAALRLAEADIVTLQALVGAARELKGVL